MGDDRNAKDLAILVTWLGRSLTPEQREQLLEAHSNELSDATLAELARARRKTAAER